MRSIRAPERVTTADVAEGVTQRRSLGEGLPGASAEPLGTGSGSWEP